MIQEFKVRNYMSFRDEVTLSFEATNDTTFEDTHVVEVVPGVRLLRLGLVYGANASGKSNLISALDFLRYFWFDKKEDMDESTDVVPFLLDTDTPGQPTEFELVFYVGAVKYRYNLSLTESVVVAESLSYYKTVQPVRLFSRGLENGQAVVDFGPSVKISKAVRDEITPKCLPNMSFFAARNQVNCSLPEIDAARDWMKTGIMQVIGPRTEIFGYAGHKIIDGDNSLKDHIIKFLRKADFNITGIMAQKSLVPLTDNIRDAIDNDRDLSDSEKKEIIKAGGIPRIRTEFEVTVINKRGKERYMLPRALQSDGTNRAFGIEAAIYEAIQNQRFLPVDEIEASLHPDLVEFIIAEFLRAGGRSQLVATSHYDPLLNTVDDLIRKDSVWFTEKEPDGNSELYSLVEFKELNKISSFQRSYRKGAFGALPDIKG